MEHKMCVLINSTDCVLKISHYKKNWARYDHKHIGRRQILKKFVLSGQIF
jgi:hypothetical protein